MRVEALASPSEHIPALMERVKPIYLSRTYGIPLPDAADPSTGWPAETFLDKMARMKGRLLKGGEPDLDSVAKIMLSDWTRGRIPFFVPPPERSEELNAAEAKAGKRDVKGKAKASEQEEAPRVPGVVQKLGSIIQKNTFVPEDIKPLDEEDAGVADEEAAASGEGSGDEDAEGEVDDEAEVEPELAWNDVFKGDDPAAEEVPTVFSKLDLGEKTAAASDDKEKAGPKKETRVKTSKVCASASVIAFIWLTLVVI